MIAVVVIMMVVMMVVIASSMSMMIIITSMLRIMIRMWMKYVHSTMHGGRDLYGCSKQGAVGIGYVGSNSSSYCVCIGGGIAW